MAAGGDGVFGAGSNDSAGFSDDGESAIQMHAGKPLKPAAVLILIINRPEAPTLLFISAPRISPITPARSVFRAGVSKPMIAMRSTPHCAKAKRNRRRCRAY